MKKIFLFLFALCTMQSMMAQSELLGKWNTFKRGKLQSTVEIYKGQDNMYHGKIVALADPKKQNDVCEECEGADKGKKIIGLVIIRNMKFQGGKLTGGTVLDPQNGKTYHATLSYDAEKKSLKLRGSLDKAGIFGRTEYWKR